MPGQKPAVGRSVLDAHCPIRHQTTASLHAVRSDTWLAAAAAPCDHLVGQSFDSRAINLPQKLVSLSWVPALRPSNRVALPTVPLHTLGRPRHKRHTTNRHCPGESGGGARRSVRARKTSQWLETKQVTERAALPGTWHRGQFTGTRGLRRVPWKRRSLAKETTRILEKKREPVLQAQPSSSHFPLLTSCTPFGNKASYWEHPPTQAPRTTHHSSSRPLPPWFPSSSHANTRGTLMLPCEYPGDS